MSVDETTLEHTQQQCVWKNICVELTVPTTWPREIPQPLND